MTAQGPAFPISFSGEDGKENVMYNIYHGIFARETYMKENYDVIEKSFPFLILRQDSWRSGNIWQIIPTCRAPGAI